jgi:multidrug efflux pump subunit AcrA (membrane-fusion protein)
MVDVAIEDQDAALMQPGDSAAIKLDGLPTRTFRGKVDIISPQSYVEGEARYFYARVSFPNSDGAVRAGMEGRGKVVIGWRPVGYVLFRGPARWIWSKLWWWFGW